MRSRTFFLIDPYFVVNLLFALGLYVSTLYYSFPYGKDIHFHYYYITIMCNLLVDSLARIFFTEYHIRRIFKKIKCITLCMFIWYIYNFCSTDVFPKIPSFIKSSISILCIFSIFLLYIMEEKPITLLYLSNLATLCSLCLHIQQIHKSFSAYPPYCFFLFCIGICFYSAGFTLYFKTRPNFIYRNVIINDLCETFLLAGTCFFLVAELLFSSREKL